MSRRKQARPRSCRESLEDRMETGTPEAFLGDGKEGEGVSLDMDNLSGQDGVLVSGDGEKTDEGNQGDTGVEDTGEFTCDNCDQVFYSLTKLLYHSNFECSAGPDEDCVIDLSRVFRAQPQGTQLPFPPSFSLAARCPSRGIVLVAPQGVITQPRLEERSHDAPDMTICSCSRDEMTPVRCDGLCQPPAPSPSPASIYSGDTSQSPSSMDCEPMSPSVAALTPEEVPFSVGLSENHPYGCQFCEKAFSRLGYLKKHEQIHQDLLPYKCEFCFRSFKHKRSRDRHVKMHTGDKKYRCCQCSAAFARSDHLKIHEKNHQMGKPFLCPECNCSFTSLGTLTAHMMTHKSPGEAQFSCPQCGARCQGAEALQVHLSRHCAGPSSTSSGERGQGRVYGVEEARGQRTVCPVCSEVFMSIEELMEHMPQHNVVTFSMVSPTRPVSTSSMASQNDPDQITSPGHFAAVAEDKNVCPYCYREDFPTLELLEIHMQSVHSVKPTDIYTCNYCNAPYPNLYSLHEHMRVIHKNQPCLDIKYPCSFCSMEFNSIELLAEHRHQKHNRMVNSPQQHKQILEAITCIQCSMVFENPATLQEHLMMVHAKNMKEEMKTPAKRHKSSSGQSSSNNNHDTTVTKHLRAALFSKSPSQNGTVTQESKPNTGVTCDQCNATFTNMEDFQCHMKLHLGAGGGCHRCSYCNKDFPTSDLLETHTFVHFLHQSTEYGCTSCVKIFHKPDELQKHLMDIHAHHLYRCSLCKEIFDSKVNIQVHFAIKHSNECKLFKCTECGSMFRSEMEWQLHVKVSHLQIAKPFRCLFCRDSFVTEIELQCHLTTHKKSFHCTMCSESFHVEYLLDKHLEEAHNPERHLVTETVHIKVEKENIHVNVTSTTPSSLLPTKSPEPSTSLWKTMETCVWYTCNICDTKFNQPAALQLHKLQEHQQKISSPSKLNPSPQSPVTKSSSQTTTRVVAKSPHSGSQEHTEGGERLTHGCCFCSQTFRSKTEMDKHMKIHVNSGGQKCNICDEVFSSANVLAEHKLQHCKVPQGNVCVGCKKTLKTEEQFYIHSQEHAVQGAMMQCIICRQSLASMIELQMHGKHHFQVKPSFYTCCVCLKTFDSRENLISKLNSSGRTYYVCKPCYHGEMSEHMCQQCGATFPSRDLLDSHVLTHRKTYQCIKCQESFSSEYEIQIHVATHMIQEGNIHECKLCLKTFESPAKLQCHLIEHTYGSSEMRCHVCGSLFMRAVDIQAHAVEHGLPARSYCCSQCNQKFFFSAELENHLLSHTQEGTSSSSSPSELGCPDCTQTFSDIAKLHAHRKLHEKSSGAYKCSLCQDVFSNIGEMQTHFFSIHADGQAAKNGFTCTECSLDFTNLANLQTHMKIHSAGKENRKSHMKSHSNVKPFVCPICGKGFSRKGHVKDHMRVHFAQDPTNPDILESIQDPDNGSTSDTLSPASDGGPWKSNNAVGDDESSEVNQAWTNHSEEGAEEAEMDSGADNDNEAAIETTAMMG
ncbi:zinc finger protein 423-like [Liolophura sinensis]|uniref:zinc finger protein 423-like n=1 Tax=Liolophura sinensis TaxID=3198878 RepID=UPI00315863DA